MRGRQVAVPDKVREGLRRLADALIPEGEGMPSAGQADVAGRQLDLVLAARPDLAPRLEAAFAEDPGDDPRAWLDALEARDASAHDAVILAVVAGYYMNPDVKARLGYQGQTPRIVGISYPEYVTEGLLERVLERGPIYRPTPAAPRPD